MGEIAADDAAQASAVHYPRLAIDGLDELVSRADLAGFVDRHVHVRHVPVPQEPA